MLVYAWVHIGVLFFGALLLAHGAAQKRVGTAIPGILLFVLALWGMCYVFPLDWLLPGNKTAAEYKLDNYTIRFGQQPSIDFYETYVDVVRPDGKTARRWVDADGDKIWGARTERVGDRVYFRRMFSPRDSTYTPWVDVVTSEVYTRMDDAAPVEALNYK